MAAPRPKARLSNPASVRAFREWLAACGAEVLAPTSEYEIVRFRSGAGLSVIYRNARGTSNSMTNQAEVAWTRFKNGLSLDLAPAINDENSRPIPSSDAAIVEHAAASPITIAFLMDLDLVTMREATKRLFGLERTGRLVRNAGRRVLTWGAAL